MADPRAIWKGKLLPRSMGQPRLPGQSQVIRLLSFREMNRMMFPDNSEICDQLLPRIGAQFRLMRRQTFASEGLITGKRWATLSSQYAARKASERPGRKILVYDGGLRSSLTKKSDAHHVVRCTLDGEIILGTTHPLARIHARGNARLPKRNPMTHSKAQTESYMDRITQWLVPRFRRQASFFAASAKARRRGL